MFPVDWLVAMGRDVVQFVRRENRVDIDELCDQYARLKEAAYEQYIDIIDKLNKGDEIGNVVYLWYIVTYTVCDEIQFMRVHIDQLNEVRYKVPAQTMRDIKKKNAEIIQCLNDIKNALLKVIIKSSVRQESRLLGVLNELLSNVNTMVERVECITSFYVTFFSEYDGRGQIAEQKFFPKEEYQENMCRLASQYGFCYRSDEKIFVRA